MFISLYLISVFYLSLIEQSKIINTIFMIYTTICLLITFSIVNLLDNLLKITIITIITSPYTSLFIYIAITNFFKSEKTIESTWILSKLSRLMNGLSFVIIAVVETSLVFIDYSIYHIVFLLLATISFHIGINLGSFKVTSKLLDQLGNDYMFISFQGVIITTSDSFKQDSLSNSFFSMKKPLVEDLNQIVDLDDLTNVRSLQSLQDRIMQRDFQKKIPLKLTFNTPNNQNTYLLELTSCSLSSLHKSKIYMVLFKVVEDSGAAEEMRKEYLSAIVHDLRNQLVTASGYTSLIKKKWHSEDKVTITRLETIQKKYARMETLIERLSVTTKRKKQEQTLEREEIGIFEIFAKVVDNLKMLLMMKKTKLKLFFDPPEDVIINADSEMLILALENIVHNSIKYSLEGTTINIKSDRNVDEQVVVIKISDQGIGIPLAEQSKLFTPNFRASNAKLIQGEGIGLYHTSRIIKEHKGTIKLMSEGIGKGTTVIIKLPYKNIARKPPPI